MEETSLNPLNIFTRSYSFDGKFTRLEFLIYMILVNIPIGLLTSFLLSGPQEDWSYVAMIPIFLILVVSELGAVARRLQSVGLSSWFALLLFVPIVNILLILALIFIPGQPQP
ncbi:MAG TPA: DUF805 domain-containing protein [Aggregatilineales bacterium]|nr:DUF805 domain-containing protein [Aggregatilineales bacterium]